uniref:Methyltransferase FkbM domain-containing protein n=1 Tax=viral metagenome TaxID=1070528 RepID=A0A6C0DP79_9ZZZZ
MLLDPIKVYTLFETYGISIRGILHVGAHECEELEVYSTKWDVDSSDIVWIDANPRLIEQNKKKGIPNCYTAVLDECERETNFHITNNGQSSSLLEFGTHATSYPWCVVTETIPVKTQTLTQFFEKNSLDPTKYNIWNFDIQGVEYQVLHGSTNMLQYADCIYSEVNTADVYKGCGQLKEMDALLESHGFQRVLLEMTDQAWGDALYLRIGNSSQTLLHYPEDCHPKNKESMLRMCKSMGIRYEATNDRTQLQRNDYTYLWLPMFWISPDEIPSHVKILYGPHHFIFPKGEICKASNPKWSNRCVYTSLSNWVQEMYKEFSKQTAIPILPLPFGIDERLEDVSRYPKQIDCIVYFKRRDPKDLAFACKLLEKKRLTYKLFEYTKYKEADYKALLKSVRFVLWIGSHESQGFAMQECLAMNIPVLVWDALSMFDEYGSYKEYKGTKELAATTVPVWSSLCGERILRKYELSDAIDHIRTNGKHYSPRSYILEKLGDRVCMKRMLDSFRETPSYIVLVLASFENPLYEQFLKLRKLQFKHYEIPHLFLYDDTVPEGYTMDEHDLCIPKTVLEGAFNPELNPSMILKFIQGLRHIKEKYDYVVRINVSTYFHPPRLLKLLSDAPRTKYAGGMKLSHIISELDTTTPTTFLSGTCMIFSKDSVEELKQIPPTHPLLDKHNDDVILSKLISAPLTHIPMFLWEHDAYPSIEECENYTLFRVKHFADRTKDIEHWTFLLSHLDCLETNTL